VPGYADFSSRSALAPANITLSDNIDASKALIKFEYSSADPQLVSHSSVSGTDIPRYDPGSNGELRLWDTITPTRDPAGVASGGDYIADGASIPASDLFNEGSHSATIYMEGINPGDPNNTRIVVRVDPDGKSGFIATDAVRVTVSRLQIVYTDVSGITHDAGDPLSILAVPRISSDLEPQGIATDWMNGVDDGSSLVIRAVASPSLAALSGQSGSSLQVEFGQTYAPSKFDSSLDANDGYLHGVDDGFVSNPDEKLATLGIEDIGQQWGSTGLTVIDAQFYRPPNEFDLADSTDTGMERRIPLAVEAVLNGTQLDQGGKPAGLTLTRPPLVLVHGMNSGPSAWDGSLTGGQSFNQSVSGEYPHTFAVDHSGVDPANPSFGTTYGEGEIADMYKFVEQTIGQATNAYRSGTFFNGDPYAPPNPNNPAAANAMIAVQKVDVVAHSYGGLLTRWYIEQSGDFEDRRDVRKLVELGTPNLGAPLANMVDEIYSNPVIAAAAPNVTLANIASLLNLVMVLDTIGKSGSGGMPSDIGGTVAPFFEDAGVGSQRLTQLNANPFNSSVGYAAVVGTQSTFTTFPGLSGLTNLYDDVEPMSSNGLNYFPWLNQFDGSQTDTIVPTWSASLGVPAYNFQIPAIHTDLPKNAAVQAQVLKWLSDPNVPLGSAQAAAWDDQPPVDDQNAYKGAAVTSTGRVLGGGLNPDAIVGVSFDKTGMSPVTWDTSVADVGIKTPILTGMIKVADIGSEDFVVGAAYSHGDSLPLHDLGKLGQAALNIPAGELLDACPNDWVAFHVTSATIGRRHDPVLTGPSGQSGTGVYGVDYSMGDLPGGNAPPTQITLPAFTLDTPTSSGTKVFVTGAVEATGSGAASQTTEVDLYAKEPPLVADIELAAFTFSITHPVGVWDGVLLPYSDGYQLVTDMNGNVYGNQGYSNENHPQVYQYLIESSDVSNGQSQPVQL
jgi:pimeloyl-ACP methyl ester carboxylesterase